VTWRIRLGEGGNYSQGMTPYPSSMRTYTEGIFLKSFQ
jgi:hypothetical protein